MHQKATLLTVLLGYSGVLFAHGNVHEHIHRLDLKIAHHPQDVSQLIERGQLLLNEGHADAALADFKTARRMAPGRIEILYYLARAQLMLKKPDSALQSAKTFLRNVNNDSARARGHILIGDILSASAKPLQAGEAYLSALGLSHEAEPDYWLNAANAFHTAGKTDKAIAILNDGIRRLGPLHVLNARAVDLELEQKQYSAALHWVDQMLATRQRTPFLLYQKGKILKSLDRADESRQTFTLALQAIDRLAESRRQSHAFQELKTLLLTEIN